MLKNKWKEERRNKKKFSLDKIQMESQDIQAHALQLNKRIKNVTWFLLKISQMENGLLKYWILIDKKILIVKRVHALRKIFVNSLEEEDSGNIPLS